MKVPRILIAMNSFKGSLSNREACAAVGEALTKLQIPFLQIPVGDGGRGSRDTLKTKWKGELLLIPSTGPMGRPANAQVLCSPNNKAPTKIFIESPDVCGFSLVENPERNIMRATSAGLGDLLFKCHALFRSTLKEIYIGLGDSAISDAGIGMLSHLGFQFQDGQGTLLEANGQGLTNLGRIIPPQKDPLSGVKLRVLCDVSNPLCGDSGSAAVFSPQKGASPAEVEKLKRGMDIFAQLVTPISGRLVANTAQTGAAGGLSAALYGLLNGELFPGAKFLLDQVDFDQHLQASDLLITGEGRTDRQTLSGKAPKECLSRASQFQKSAVILSGSLGEGAEFKDNPRFLGCFSCGREPSAYEALRREATKLFSEPEFLARI